MMSALKIPSACQTLYDDLNKIRDERNELSNELKSASPGEKPFIAAQIKALLPKLTAAQQAFETCFVLHSPPTSTFPVTVEATVKADQIVHTHGTDLITMELDPVGQKCILDNWPDLVMSPITVEGYNDVITIQLNSSTPGVFNKSTGAMSFTANFTISNSITFSSDSPLKLNFTTGTVNSPLGPQVGKPMDATGNFVMVAAGTTSHDGSAHDLPVIVKLTGKFSPHP